MSAVTAYATPAGLRSADWRPDELASMNTCLQATRDQRVWIDHAGTIRLTPGRRPILAEAALEYDSPMWVDHSGAIR